MPKKVVVNKEPAKKAPAKQEAVKKAPAKQEAVKKAPAKQEAVKKAPTKQEAVKKAPVKKELAKKEPVKKEPAKQEKVIKETMKKEIVRNEFPRNLFEMQETEIVNNRYMRSPSAREGRNGMTRVSREEISDKINEAIDALGASKRNVTADKLRRAEEEIDRALRILLKAQREITARRSWYISE
ncbi:hypothetical protein [Paenibacillus sp. Soil787]|uniref:hypothetical protein n=1 Tax=Paenibacillus sp. Soil787 TaxID=1736411 RepID=UPI0006F9AF42|nr:hypothetical protein [Paenibacillus sp. Soil787]KRF43876.1 hypothetical protein ASG93_02885 [Paenibacillus sp. Soil787]